jgi:hypothetical protein
LYAKARAPLAGAAYELDEVERTEENRDIVKKAFISLVNATGHIRRPAPENLPSKSNDPSSRLTWAELKAAIGRRHPQIVQYFQSGIGTEMQRADSNIAEDIMLSMARQDILVLPIHDSFVVD